MKFRVTGIKWDIGKEDIDEIEEEGLEMPSLPETDEIELDEEAYGFNEMSKDEIDEIVVDELSEKHTWLIEGIVSCEVVE